MVTWRIHSLADVVSTHWFLSANELLFPVISSELFSVLHSICHSSDAFYNLDRLISGRTNETHVVLGLLAVFKFLFSCPSSAVLELV